MKPLIVLSVLALFAGCAQIAMVPAYDGVVRDAKTGAPIQGATVSAMHLPRHEWKSQTTSDSEGTFHLQAVKIWKTASKDSKPNTILIRVAKKGYAPFEQIVYSEQKIVAALSKMEPGQSTE
ncbi:MAG: carboxypeptidase-like regulatory domain-containing protein [Nibricoccus sp.]